MKNSRVLWLASCLVGMALSTNSVWSASCGGSTATFTNKTAAAIPSPGTVSSTILVSGAGPYLLDLNAQTFIAHTRNGHLQVTLTSPSGTISTLTSNNGGSFAGVFNGTVWDDQANPGGQVPYEFNPGLVTDNPYAEGVVATPLVPEEAMGAFIGENPNGLWTLTIADMCTENPPSETCADDNGNLTSWSLYVTSLPAAPASASRFFRNLDVTDIPYGPSVTTSSIDVAGAGTYLGKLRLHTFLAYPVGQDLDVTLKSPAGTVVTLTTDNGGSFADVFDDTDWFDKANPGGTVPYANNDGLVTDRFYTRFPPAPALVPEEALSAFNSEKPNGRWTMTISVDEPGHRGTLDDWELEVTTLDVSGGDCTLACPGDITVPSSNACDSAVTYPPPVAGPCCGAVTCTVPSGSVFPKGTTTVVCSTQSGQSCSFNVTVQDATPPVVTLSATSTLLWPPNHNMIDVGLAASAADGCDPHPSIAVAVYGDEDDELQTGDGNFSPDALRVAPGTLQLRAERQGNSDGRVYLIIGTATDASANRGYNCATVVVPHSQSKADINSVLAQAAAARAYCAATGMPPPAYVVVGDGPVIGPKQATFTLGYDNNSSGGPATDPRLRYTPPPPAGTPNDPADGLPTVGPLQR
jgi:subtilisin-like proprotein convertase family protein